MTKLTLARVLRLAIALALLIVIVVILWYFLSHRRPQSIVPPKNEEMPAEKVERQEGIEHFDFKGDRVIRAKADRHYAGEDGRYYLDGNVEIRDLGKEGGEEIVLFGQRVSYDKNWTEIFLEGKAKLVYEGLTVESSAFTYQKRQELLTTDQGVTFSSRKISGKAQKMAYSFKASSVRLENDVEVEFREEKEPGRPFIVRGDTVTFFRKRRKGEVEGNASFSFDRSHGQADTLRFDLTPDEQSARSFFLKGNVQAVLIEQQEPSSEELQSTEEKRELSAAEVDVHFSKGRRKISSVEARNRCVLVSSTPEGRTTEVRSDLMNLGFDPRGMLKELLATNAATLVERSPTSEVERSISGEEIFMSAKGRTWRVKAPEGGEARVDSQDSDVTAKSLIISQLRETLSASGDVRIIVKLQQGGEESVGFFSNEQPVLGAAQEMRYEKNLDRLELTKAVRMWQGKEVVFADELTVLKRTGEIQAQGNVRTVFSRRRESEKQTEEKIEIGGAKLSFSPSENVLNFEQNCWFKSDEVGLNSDWIAVSIRGKPAEVQEIEARGKVTITEKIREGKGEKAIYNLGEDTITLTGNPSVVDKEKGVIKGEKLTFRLGEGRIQVENKERERSTTVIKF